jgi:hypothetical protein
MKEKKLTQQQRISRLEKVCSEAWILGKMLEKEVGILQKKVKELSGGDEEE